MQRVQTLTVDLFGKPLFLHLGLQAVPWCRPPAALAVPNLSAGPASAPKFPGSERQLDSHALGAQLPCGMKSGFYFSQGGTR